MSTRAVTWSMGHTSGPPACGYGRGPRGRRQTWHVRSRRLAGCRRPAPGDRSGIDLPVLLRERRLEPGVQRRGKRDLAFDLIKDNGLPHRIDFDPAIPAATQVRFDGPAELLASVVVEVFRELLQNLIAIHCPHSAVWPGPKWSRAGLPRRDPPPRGFAAGTLPPAT